MALRNSGPGKSTETRKIAPLSLRASFRPESVNAEKRTVELVWTTGARVKRSSWFDGAFFEELSLEPGHVRMERLQSGRAPLLDSHSGWGVDSILGVVESARVDGQQGVAVVRFPKAEDDESADKIFRKVRDGIIANVSVGYRVNKFEELEERVDNLPVFRAVDWEPFEVSLVSMPADAGAGVRSATAAGEVEGRHVCEFITRGETTMAVENVPAEQPAATPPAADDTAKRAADIKAERERVSGIIAIVRRANLGDAMADELIAKGASVEETRAAAFDKLATESEKVRTEQHIGSGVEVGEADREKFMRGALAGLLRRAGLAEKIRAAQKTALGEEKLAGVDVSPSPYQRFSIPDLARECLERSGVRTRGMDRHQLVAAALAKRSGPGLASSSDFSILLESAMHKSLLGAYAVQPNTWSRFCGRKPVSDFRDHGFYRNGSFGTLDQIGESGEVHTKSIPDGEKVSLSVNSYGNRIGLTRKAMVNDDMGAFNDLAARFGATAMDSIESAVYALLALNAGLGPTQTDSQPFFNDANRKNVASTAAISVEAIDADAVKMAYQLDPSGNKKLDLRPTVLLVPRGIEGTARVINDSQYDTVASKLQVPNKVRGMFRDIIGSAQLAAGTTRRYLFADPALYPALVVAFLEGQESPVLESQDGWEVDGMEWRVLFDFGVKAFDPRATVTNAG